MWGMSTWRVRHTSSCLASRHRKRRRDRTPYARLRSTPRHAHVAAPSPPHLRLSHPVPSIRLEALLLPRELLFIRAHHLARPPVRLRDSAHDAYFGFSLPLLRPPPSEPCALPRNNLGRFSLFFEPRPSIPPPPTLITSIRQPHSVVRYERLKG